MSDLIVLVCWKLSVWVTVMAEIRSSFFVCHCHFRLPGYISFCSFPLLFGRFCVSYSRFNDHSWGSAFADCWSAFWWLDRVSFFFLRFWSAFSSGGLRSLCGHCENAWVCIDLQIFLYLHIPAIYCVYFNHLCLPLLPSWQSNPCAGTRRLGCLLRMLSQANSWRINPSQIFNLLDSYLRQSGYYAN